MAVRPAFSYMSDRKCGLEAEAVFGGHSIWETRTKTRGHETSRNPTTRPTRILVRINPHYVLVQASSDVAELGIFIRRVVGGHCWKYQNASILECELITLAALDLGKVESSTISILVHHLFHHHPLGRHVEPWSPE
jgi:hypothetical protein